MEIVRLIKQFIDLNLCCTFSVWSKHFQSWWKSWVVNFFTCFKLFCLFQGSVNTYSKLIENISAKLLDATNLPDFGNHIYEILKTPIQTNSKVIDGILTLLLDNEGRILIAEELAIYMAGISAYWQLFEYPIEILAEALWGQMLADEKFALKVKNLSSPKFSARIGFVVGEPCGSIMSVIWWIVGEFVAWLIDKLLVRIIDKLQTADKSLEGVTVRVADLGISVMNYISVCARSNEEWVIRLREMSEKFIKWNASLAWMFCSHIHGKLTVYQYLLFLNHKIDSFIFTRPNLAFIYEHFGLVITRPNLVHFVNCERYPQQKASLCCFVLYFPLIVPIKL